MMRGEAETLISRSSFSRNEVLQMAVCNVPAGGSRDPFGRRDRWSIAERACRLGAVEFAVMRKEPHSPPVQRGVDSHRDTDLLAQPARSEDGQDRDVKREH